MVIDGIAVRVGTDLDETQLVRSFWRSKWSRNDRAEWADAGHVATLPVDFHTGTDVDRHSPCRRS